MKQQINDLHEKAMTRLDFAMANNRKGNSEKAKQEFRQAFFLERAAAELVLTLSEPYEPTRSVLLRSAATLALDCEQYDEALRLAVLGLSGSPDEPIKQELRDVLKRVEREGLNYEAVPLSAAVIVHDQLTIARSRVRLVRDETSFRDGLATLMHALEFNLGLPRTADQVLEICSEIGKVAIYLKRELLGSARQPLIWRICERLLRFNGVYLNPEQNAMDELRTLLEIERVSYKDVRDWLVKNSEILNQSSGQTYPGH